MKFTPSYRARVAQTEARKPGQFRTKVSSQPRRRFLYEVTRLVKRVTETWVTYKPRVLMVEVRAEDGAVVRERLTIRRKPGWLRANNAAALG